MSIGRQGALPSPRRRKRGVEVADGWRVRLALMGRSAPRGSSGPELRHSIVVVSTTGPVTGQWGPAGIFLLESGLGPRGCCAANCRPSRFSIALL